MMELVVSCSADRLSPGSLIVRVAIGGMDRSVSVPGPLSAPGLALVTAKLEADLKADVDDKVKAQKREAKHTKAIQAALKKRAPPEPEGDE